MRGTASFDGRWHQWRGLIAAAILVGATTAVGMVGRTHLMLPDMVALYLLAITISARVYGRGPSLLAATLSVLAYDFFFIPPVFIFAVTPPPAHRHIRGDVHGGPHHQRPRTSCASA
jgi:K+-sensing histidine kinase KdpD